MDDARYKMSRRSRREVSPPPPPAAAAAAADVVGCFDSSIAASVQIDGAMDVPPEAQAVVSAWLYHSNDPINGNCKRNESYWADVIELYNSTTPINRKREVKHLKDRWQRIKRTVAYFCASWAKATSIYPSGYSEDQLKDIALKFYSDDYPKEGPFTLLHCWKILRDEPKWHSILKEPDKSNKRSLDDGDTVRLEDIGEKERPMGMNEAKKQRNSKGKFKDDDPSLHEDMKKYMDIQVAASKRHEEFIETQQRISDAKVEAVRLRRESVLLESYQKLLTMDTSQMADDMKAEHVIGLKILKDKLLGNTN
ncbi:glutathione S-transferase T3-like [Oryza brachyantha]|uniref:glutathione S-transferase T3-like n=1 Tax=Oryza brachyantha TaxID=4533 RepID=UPI001ADB6A6A|nr:glutathione S-transferase T3-like [Oryza brachyantha]